MKEATAVSHAVKLEGGLDLVEEAKVVLEALSAPVDVVKLKVGCLEEMIAFKGQIPEKVPRAVQVDKLKKLLDAYPFHRFSPRVQMKYYNNYHIPSSLKLVHHDWYVQSNPFLRKHRSAGTLG